MQRPKRSSLFSESLVLYQLGLILLIGSIIHLNNNNNDTELEIGSKIVESNKHSNCSQPP